MTTPREDQHRLDGAPDLPAPVESMGSAFEFVLDGRRFRAEFARPIDLSSPIRFDAEDPALFGAGQPRSAALTVGVFVADVRRGGSVNADRLDLVPHAHGTHTETAGHLAVSRLPICDLALTGPVPTTLATVCTDSDARVEAGPIFASGDRVVTAGAIEQVLRGADPAFLCGLVLRVAGSESPSDPPPDRSDHVVDARQPVPEHPFYLSGPAAGRLAAAGVRHLVLETPSIDRLEDGGRLAAHRAFWEFGDRGNEPSEARREATITELARIPPGLRDGLYLLDLHLPNLGTDAVPSRPVLYTVTPSPRSP